LAKRIKFGDIIEIKTSKGYGYMQYTHKDSMLGNLVRVFKGIYIKPLEDLQVLEDKEIQFTTFFPLQTAVNQNIVTVIANKKVRKDLQPFPLLKSMLAQDKETWKAKSWELWDGEKVIGLIRPPLTQEQINLPISEVINDTLLIERIDSGWTTKLDLSI